MAIRVNLDDQTFWAPRPLSRPRCIDGQSHIRPLPQPKFSLLPLNDSRGMIGVPKESPDSSPTLASDRNDIIYISDEAASEINDASPGLFDESLPSIQSIVQSLEDAERMGNADDGFEQLSQRRDAHGKSGRSADSTEQELLNESHRPTIDIAAACPVGISASTSRICRSALTSMAERSRIDNSSCEFSLWDADSQHARGSSVSAYDEGTKKPSLSEIPQRGNSHSRPHSSILQPQQPPSPLDDDCIRVGMTLEGSPGPSQRASTEDNSFDVFDTALGHTDTSYDKSSDETLTSVRTAVRCLEETGEIRSRVGDGEQTSDSERERVLYHGPHSSTLLDRGQIDHSAGFSCAELAGCLTEAPSIPRIRSPTASTRASSRLSLSPESQVWDTPPAQTSCTSVSAPDNGVDEIDDQICTVTEPPEKAANDSSEGDYTCDEEPLTSRMPPRAQNKRSRESWGNHGIEQSEAEGLHGTLDDPEYCPSPSDESEDDSNSPSGDEEQRSRKRRKFRAEPNKIESQRQQNAYSEPAIMERASELTSAAQEHASTVAESTDAEFDEWILQDVVLKRTIMSGKATFLFHFDWDLCAKHGQAVRKPCKRSEQQGQAQIVVKNNGRRRFTALEDEWLSTWKGQQGLCWAEIHSRFCAKFGERSKEALQVRYCTRLKQREDD